MVERKRDEGADARNRGVEKQADELREPGRSPPRKGVERASPAIPAVADEDTPAAPEHLENPPQVEGPRERVNESGSQA